MSGQYAMPEANSECRICATSPNLMKFVHLITGFKVATSDRATIQSMTYCIEAYGHINKESISCRKTGGYTDLWELMAKLFRNETRNKTQYTCKYNN